MRVEAYASRPHYWAHIEPIYDELERRGHIMARTVKPRPDPNLLTLVASVDDARAVGTPVVYVEHGAGQTYDGVMGQEHPSGWPGTRGLDNVRLFVCPGEHVAEKWRATYSTPIAVVGAPILDPFIVTEGAESRVRRDEIPVHHRTPKDIPVVGVTCHWRCGVTEETMPALPHHYDALPELARRYRLLGHGHPRIWLRVERLWKHLGVMHTPDVREVLSRVDLLIADNTSTMYEAAALDIPIVALNAPWYRKDVEHGLRFWSHVPGLQCDDPLDLPDVVAEALTDPPHARALRAAAVEHVYAHRDGRAAHRAADAIEGLLMETDKPAHMLTGEVGNPLDELIERLRLLGASDDEIEAFRNDWPTWDDEEQTALRGASDRTIVADIKALRDEYDFHTLTADEQAERDRALARTAELNALARAAYDEVHAPVAEVLAWIDAAPTPDEAMDRARAIMQWEIASDTPRKTLISTLEGRGAFAE